MHWYRSTSACLSARGEGPDCSIVGPSSAMSKASASGGLAGNPQPGGLVGAGQGVPGSPGRRRWALVGEAADGDCVLMRQARYPVHVGVWLDADGGGVLHCSGDCGVVFQRPERSRSTAGGSRDFIVSRRRRNDRCSIRRSPRRGGSWANAFMPNRDRAIRPVTRARTVRGWLDAQGIDEFAAPTMCLYNGAPLMRPEWHSTVIGRGDICAFTPYPMAEAAERTRSGPYSPSPSWSAVSRWGARFRAFRGGVRLRGRGGRFRLPDVWGVVHGLISGAAGAYGGALVNA